MCSIDLGTGPPYRAAILSWVLRIYTNRNGCDHWVGVQHKAVVCYIYPDTFEIPIGKQSTNQFESRAGDRYSLQIESF
jgi:hypothetical protein